MSQPQSRPDAVYEETTAARNRGWGNEDAEVRGVLSAEERKAERLCA